MEVSILSIESRRRKSILSIGRTSSRCSAELERRKFWMEVASPRCCGESEEGHTNPTPNLTDLPLDAMEREDE